MEKLTTQKVVSREYKEMLKRECFLGPRGRLIVRAGEFWKSFRNLIKGAAFGADGSFHKFEKRTISFYDTPEHQLHNNHYIFRERIESETEKREVTLKFRHPDRYISQGRDMTTGPGAKKSKTKFEGDIKFPFQEFYAFSSDQEIAGGKSLSNMDDLAKLYPGLKDSLQPFQKDEEVHIVGNFVAEETVFTGADFQIGKKPEVKAECALIVWHDKTGDPNEPAVVEFSFRYQNEREEYPAETAQRAYDLFRALRVSLPDWIDVDGPTKTDYVYSRT